jgi:hypothetical protein
MTESRKFLTFEDEPQILNLQAAARRVHRSRRTISRWVREGLPHHDDGGQKFILLADLLTFWRDKMLAERRGQFVAGGHRVRAAA